MWSTIKKLMLAGAVYFVIFHTKIGADLRRKFISENERLNQAISSVANFIKAPIQQAKDVRDLANEKNEETQKFTEGVFDNKISQ
jgi:hypothetical protein